MDHALKSLPLLHTVSLCVGRLGVGLASRRSCQKKGSVGRGQRSTVVVSPCSHSAGKSQRARRFIEQGICLEEENKSWSCTVVYCDCERVAARARCKWHVSLSTRASGPARDSFGERIQVPQEFNRRATRDDLDRVAFGNSSVSMSSPTAGDTDLRSLTGL